MCSAELSKSAKQWLKNYLSYCCLKMRLLSVKCPKLITIQLWFFFFKKKVTLHVAFVHAFVNPTLFLVLHKGLRKATLDLLCCNFRSSSTPNSAQNGNALAGSNGGTRSSNLRGSTRNLNENIAGAATGPALDSRGNLVAVQDQGIPHHNSRTYM